MVTFFISCGSKSLALRTVSFFVLFSDELSRTVSFFVFDVSNVDLNVRFKTVLLNTVFDLNANETLNTV